MHIGNIQAQVDITESQLIDENGCQGWRTQKVGTRTAVVEVLVDLDLLKKYAHKALKNKSGRTTLADGAVVLRIVKGTERERKGLVKLWKET